MNFYLFRRLSALVFTVFFIGASLPLIANAEQMQPTASIQKNLAELEASIGGRLGVSAINTANNERIQYRAEERFPFCSTSKVMVVAAILKESEKNGSLLQKQITYGKEEVEKSGYAPITQQHVSNGMSVNELCRAAIEYSDNMAMNLLMKILGGPDAVNAYAESINDHTFRLDRWEPELNTAIPGDNRDTTTPNAMADSLKQLALGDSLALLQREQLQAFLKNNTTGNNKIRASVPKDWLVGDKTGSGSYGTTNDVAVIWPPKCSPIVLVVYLTQKEKDAVKHDETIASATRLVLDEFAKTDQCIKAETEVSAHSSKITEANQSTVIEVVKKAKNYIRKHGTEKAIVEFRKNSDDIFMGDYNGMFYVSPLHPELIGSNQLNYKDPSGALVVQEEVEKAKSGGGWLKGRLRKNPQTGKYECRKIYIAPTLGNYYIGSWYYYSPSKSGICLT